MSKIHIEEQFEETIELHFLANFGYHIPLD